MVANRSKIIWADTLSLSLPFGSGHRNFRYASRNICGTTMEKDTMITTRWQRHYRVSQSPLYVFARSSYPLPNFHISGTSSPSTSSSATEAIAAKLCRFVLDAMVIVIKERKWDRRAIRVLTRLLVSCQTRGDRRLRHIDFNLLFDGSLLGKWIFFSQFQDVNRTQYEKFWYQKIFRIIFN